MSSQLAVIFPGQGSQSIGMVSQDTQNIFQEASEILGYDLLDIIKNGPAEKLNQTEITQPALLATSVALWKSESYKPSVLAGHSLGEYTALVCAESLSFKDAVYLVSQRGKFMQEAVPEGMGAMAAIIGLSLEEINQINQEASQGEIISAANINAPGQIVIAGHRDAIERAMEKAKIVGAKLIKKLDVSVPSHCLLMKPAAEKMKILLDQTEFKLPKIPVIQNVDAKIHQDIMSIKDALYKQLFCSVQWIATIENMVKNYNITDFIECGPGKILTGLNKRIVGSLTNV